MSAFTHVSLKGLGPSMDVTNMTTEEMDHVESKLDDLMEGPDNYQTCTPDMPLLQQKTGHYIFIYDGLKEGFARDKELLEYPLLAVGSTKGHFELYRSNHVVPMGIAIASNNPALAAPVFGEIYCVKPSTVRELDWLYSNGFQTKRLRTAINAVIDKQGTTRQVYAFVWVNLRSYWDKRMDRLSRCDLLTSNNSGRKYYTFMHKYEQIGVAA
jgi:gamma-glutamylcyclotransferase (GGCT)/AIG2-like uncharacterized protein YtfP